MIKQFFRAGYAFYFGDEYRVPLHTIAWRLLWYLPVQLCRIFFVATVAVAYGEGTARILWERTR